MYAALTGAGGAFSRPRVTTNPSGAPTSPIYLKMQAATRAARYAPPPQQLQYSARMCRRFRRFGSWICERLGAWEVLNLPALLVQKYKY